MKSYTDVEQSRKLAEILPIESADMCYMKSKTTNTYILDGMAFVMDKQMQKNQSDCVFSYEPCYSLAALLNILPPILKLKPILDLEENSIQYSGIDIYVKADNPIDACYEVILKLHELKKL